MKIDVTLDPRAEDCRALRDGFREYELSVFPSIPSETEDQPLAAFARRADGSVCAGIEAKLYWDGLEIALLWVAPDQRDKGLGTQLLLEVERVARERGAVIAFLKTFFAREFYERLGYEVFGVLEDRPIGSKLYHMKKRLDV
ncbi:GNAT family N-acetyltransferase [Acuticoccus kandeliae]|uniref:GNAT family N-acetyltransferase n=1 Tax=Acuticoccus kandeliae TaxID=2073160 RepID=UPI000D3EA187|nr:GNAT family N-acetyltransferase [Acuticoccus kandeliae]